MAKSMPPICCSDKAKNSGEGGASESLQSLAVSLTEFLQHEVAARDRVILGGTIRSAAGLHRSFVSHLQ